MATEKISIRLEQDSKNADLPIQCLAEALDPELVGHEATLSVELKVQVDDKRPVHKSKVLYQHKFQFQSRSATIQIPRHKLNAYSYDGQMIDIEVHFKIHFADIMHIKND